MEQNENEGMALDFKDLFYDLLDHVLILILSGIVLAILSAVGSKLLLKPVYTSSASLYIINRQDKKSMTLTDLQTGTQLTKDYQILVKSRPVMEQVISDLDLDLSYEQLKRMITVNAPADTRIVEIVVKSNNAYTAKSLADAIAKVSAARIVNVMDMDAANVIEQGSLPTKPSKPSILINTVFGGFLGILIASLIFILANLLNDTIKTSEDIERYLNLVTLSEIPIEEGMDKKRYFETNLLKRINKKINKKIHRNIVKKFIFRR